MVSQLPSGHVTASSIKIAEPCYLTCRRNVIFLIEGAPKEMRYGVAVAEALILAADETYAQGMSHLMGKESANRMRINLIIVYRLKVARICSQTERMVSLQSLR